MAIIGTLPYILTNGTLANADEVMADFDAIVSQVNSNALPSGGALTAGLEWTLLTGAPTYASPTIFIMSGDQTSTFTIGRRIKTTNTGGITYSTVTQALLVLDTQVTVVNSSGTLDSGLSSVSIGTLDSVNPSIPYFTNFSTGQDNGTGLPPSSTTVVPSLISAYGDALNEWNISTSRFTPRVSGTYVISLDGYLQAAAVTLTVGQFFNMYLAKNGTLFGLMSAINWPFPSGSQSNYLSFSGLITTQLLSTDYIDARIQSDAYSGGTMFWNGTMSVRRLPYA